MKNDVLKKPGDPISWESKKGPTTGVVLKTEVIHRYTVRIDENDMHTIIHHHAKILTMPETGNA